LCCLSATPCRANSCINQCSNDTQRAAFRVQEVVDLTINFYRRNYIEPPPLSSGIFKNADHTMELLVLVAKKLRIEHNFNGYIHLKTIPYALVRVSRTNLLPHIARKRQKSCFLSHGLGFAFF
jgi:predicted DNA-binding helix-hairpin-helix protein